MLLRYLDDMEKLYHLEEHVEEIDISKIYTRSDDLDMMIETIGEVANLHGDEKTEAFVEKKRENIELFVANKNQQRILDKLSVDLNDFMTKQGKIERLQKREDGRQMKFLEVVNCFNYLLRQIISVDGRIAENAKVKRFIGRSERILRDTVKLMKPARKKTPHHH